MTVLKFFDFFCDYIAPVMMTFVYVGLVFVIREALVVRRQAKREREQRLH